MIYCFQERRKFDQIAGGESFTKKNHWSMAMKHNMESKIAWTSTRHQNRIKIILDGAKVNVTVPTTRKLSYSSART
jgi:hypothetical protein